VHFSADMSLQTGWWSSVMHSVALALALACQWHWCEYSTSRAAAAESTELQQYG